MQRNATPAHAVAAATQPPREAALRPGHAARPIAVHVVHLLRVHHEVPVGLVARRGQLARVLEVPPHELLELLVAFELGGHEGPRLVGGGRAGHEEDGDDLAINPLDDPEAEYDES